MLRNSLSRLILLASVSLLQAQSVDQAWSLVRAGKQDEAIQLLGNIVTKRPSDADAKLLLGSLLMENGNPAEAVRQLTAAITLRPRFGEAQNALGEAYTRLGDKKSARSAFQKAVALQPTLGIAQLNLGENLGEAGDLKAAEPHLDRAIALLGQDSDAGEAYYWRSKIHASQNDNSSEADLEKAVALRPDLAAAWSDLGQRRKQRLDDAGALAAFEKAVAADPADAVAQYRLGAEYLQTGKAEQAAESLQKSLSLNPSDQSALNAYQIALRKSGRAAEADEVKQKLRVLLREKDRIDQNALLSIKLNNEGAEFQKNGDLQHALEKYKQALALNPNHTGIRVNYAVALLRLGQWTGGLNELHEASQKDPENATIRAALRDALAQAPPAVRPSWK